MDKFIPGSKTVVGFLIAIVAAVVDVSLPAFGITDIPAPVNGALKLLETGGSLLGFVGLRLAIAEVMRSIIGEDKSPFHSKTIVGAVLLGFCLLVDYVLPGFGIAVPAGMETALKFAEAGAGYLGIYGMRAAVGRAIVSAAKIGLYLICAGWWFSHYVGVVGRLFDGS